MRRQLGPSARPDQRTCARAPSSPSSASAEQRTRAKPAAHAPADPSSPARASPPRRSTARAPPLQVRIRAPAGGRWTCSASPCRRRRRGARKRGWVVKSPGKRRAARSAHARAHATTTRAYLRDDLHLQQLPTPCAAWCTPAASAVASLLARLAARIMPVTPASQLMKRAVVRSFAGGASPDAVQSSDARSDGRNAALRPSLRLQRAHQATLTLKQTNGLRKRCILPTTGLSPVQGVSRCDRNADSTYHDTAFLRALTTSGCALPVRRAVPNLQLRGSTAARRGRF